MPPQDKSDIRIICSDMVENDALQLEMLLILQYGRIDLGTGCLRNQTDGGEGRVGGIHSAETKHKLSILSRRNWENSDFRENMRIVRTGMKLGPQSEETKQKISAAKTGVSNGPMSEATKLCLGRSIAEAYRSKKENGIADGVCRHCLSLFVKIRSNSVYCCRECWLRWNSIHQYDKVSAKEKKRRYNNRASSCSSRSQFQSP